MRNMRAWRNFPIDFHGLLHTFSTIFFDFLCVFFFVFYVVRVFREVGIIELSARLAARQKYGVAASVPASAVAAARSAVFCLLFACN